MVSWGFSVKEFIFDVSLMIWPSFDLQIQDGRQFLAQQRLLFIQIRRSGLVIGSNESSIHAELSDRQQNYNVRRGYLRGQRSMF